MCGIVGVLSLYKKTINLRYLKPMADKISHRGPDDAGYLCFNSGTLDKKNKTFYKYFTEKKFENKSNPLPVIDSESFKRELYSQNFDLYMGHRRLSILDVSYAGHQPMSDSSKNIWISYNGEIYNFKQLRSELKKFVQIAEVPRILHRLRFSKSNPSASSVQQVIQVKRAHQQSNA